MSDFAFASMTEFWAMGGYGFFVWSSFGISLLLLVGLWWTGRRGETAFRQQLTQRLSREARVRAHQQQSSPVQESADESTS